MTPDGDLLADLPGVVASVWLWDDGRAREVLGLGSEVATDTGHFAASVQMVLETLVQTWSEIVAVDAAPLRAWALISGRYWVAGAGRRAWVLDPNEADVNTVLKRLDQR